MTLRVFTFGPDWGLPTTGPFALKLLAWLNLSGIAYEQVVENDSRKGPLGKSPWIEIDGRRMGDSDAIIRLLGERYGIDELRCADVTEQAVSHAWRCAFEERFHQILEWELFVHPAGAAYIASKVREQAPAVVASLVTASLRRHFRRQLYARGIARHTPAAIAEMGKADVDALAAYLHGRPFLGGDQPVMADLAVFGQVAPMLRWPMQTPVAMHVRQVDAVRNWCERVSNRCLATHVVDMAA